MHRFSPTIAKIMVALWVTLLFPWLLVAPAAAIAFDGGYTFEAYLFVGFVWTYPISVFVGGVLVFWKRKPLAALLPCMNVLGVLSDFLWRR